MPHRTTFKGLVGLVLGLAVWPGFDSELPAQASSSGASYYPVKLDDPQAVYLTSDRFPVYADGVRDDTAAIQQAINTVQETTGNGIVFIPPGTYRISRTIHVWVGIRLIGYGAHRPEIVLAGSTPGFQEGDVAYLFHFVHTRPRDGQPVVDANAHTFCSGMSNINLRIGSGNPAAAGVRFHVAQHCFLAHMDFHIGAARAGVHEVGNEIEDCRFFGGEYGITTGETAPSWPFVLIDSSFEGQRRAALRTHGAGPTLVRVHIRNTQTAVEISDERSDNLYVRDSSFENITGPAVVISNERSLLTMVNLEDVVLRNAPILGRFRTDGREVPGAGAVYRVKRFCHGAQLDAPGGRPEYGTTHELVGLEHAPAFVASDVPRLPAAGSWVNLAALGARGDGVTDNTEIFQQAIRQHRTLYLPTGKYRVCESLVLQADTALIGLNPITTQVVLADATPGFDGFGSPVPLIVAPGGGTNVVSGIGIDTGLNRRAVAVKWMAGATSYMNDVRFINNRSTNRLESRTALPIDSRDSQYWSLWITEGGGGVFKDIWTPNTVAQGGLFISDTATRGRVYGMSAEHHMRCEVRLRNVSNWQFYALQTEEESPAGDTAVAMSIEDCRDLTFANLHMYRVSRCRTPFPHAIRSTRSEALTFYGVRAYSSNRFPFDASFHDASRGVTVEQRELASLRINGKPSGASAPKQTPMTHLAVGGFELIDSPAVDTRGRVYFTNFPQHKIHRWSPETGELHLMHDSPIHPAAVGMEAGGRLMVVSPTGAAYTLDPEGAEGALEALAFHLPAPTRHLMAFHPMKLCRDAADAFYLTVHEGVIYRIPSDRSRIEIAARGLARTNGIALSVSGKRCYVSDEAVHRTYMFNVEPDGTLSTPRVFAEEGEGGLAVDREDNVYLCEGTSVRIFDSAGTRVGSIDVPERPGGLVFGGADRRTLFITARTSLYSVIPGGTGS